jgi:hypothetical protein
MERFLQWRPDLLPFVWRPSSDECHWVSVRHHGGKFFDSSNEESIASALGILLLYPRTKEVCHITGRSGGALPPGTAWLEDGGDNSFSLKPSEVSVGKPLIVEFTESPIWPDDSNYYSTTLTNISDEPVRVQQFGGFRRRWFKLRLNNVTGELYTKEQFQDWYNVQDDDGWIEPGQVVADYTNYGGSGGWWMYLGTTASGRDFVVGAKLK